MPGAIDGVDGSTTLSLEVSMRRALLLVTGMLVMVAMLAVGCSSRGAPGPAGRNDLVNPLEPFAAAPPDSNPNRPPHPPHPNPHPPIEAVVFVSADSAFAGDSTTTRWQLGNDSNKPFTMPWTLTSGRNWPGFPISGSLALGANATQLLLVSVTVPDTATAGPARVTMTVTRSDGTTATADGFIQVQ